VTEADAVAVAVAGGVDWTEPPELPQPVRARMRAPDMTAPKVIWCRMEFLLKR
jgi:hypothetical protein